MMYGNHENHSDQPVRLFAGEPVPRFSDLSHGQPHIAITSHRIRDPRDGTIEEANVAVLVMASYDSGDYKTAVKLNQLLPDGIHELIKNIQTGRRQRASELSRARRSGIAAAALLCAGAVAFTGYALGKSSGYEDGVAQASAPSAVSLEQEATAQDSGSQFAPNEEPSEAAAVTQPAPIEPLATPVLPSAAPTPAETPSPAAADTAASERIGVAYINILGASHTDSRSGKYKQYPRSNVRSPRLAEYLLNKQVAGAPIGIVTFSEMQKQQEDAFRRNAGKRFTLVTLPGKINDDAVAYDKTMFKKVAVEKVKYRYWDNSKKVTPEVTLRYVKSGQEFVVRSQHLPRNKGGSQAAQRNDSYLELRGAMKATKAAGAYGILGMDANEVKPAFKAMTANGAVDSSHGTCKRDGSCPLPKERRIDWLFNTTNTPTVPDSTAYDDSLRQARVTDHPVVLSAIDQPLNP